MPALSPEAQAAVDALPPGSALLVVRRGPNSGSRFLLDGELTTAGRHPQSDIFLDDVTVSRRHVEFRRARTARSRSPTSAASTAPTSTASASTRWPCPTATRCRSASTDWSSTRASGAPDPAEGRSMLRTPSGGAGNGTAAADDRLLSIGAVLERAAGGVPRGHHLQDPLPGGGGARGAAAHPVGVPEVHRRGRRAPRARPAHAARPLSAAQGDPRAPRRPGAGRAAAAARRLRGGAARSCSRSARWSAEAPAARASAGTSCSPPPGAERGELAEWEAYGLVDAGRRTATTTPRR